MSECKSSTKSLRPLSTKPLNNQKRATGNGGIYYLSISERIMKLDKNYKVRVTPEQSREIHSLILLDGGEVSYGLKPQLQDEFLVIENEYGSVVIYYTDQDIFLSAEQQEIQADDLIALLTDLSKSAENTLENTELTPEFEAVEPKFKVGDKVYVGLTGKIARVTKIIDDDVVNVANKNNEVRAWISNICHATQENYERLQTTFPDIKFEQPAKELAGSDLCRAIKAKGKKFIICAVSNISEEDAINNYLNGDQEMDVIFEIDDELDHPFVAFWGNLYKFAVPLSEETGEPLTQAVLDE
jgi:hypothetical protein